MANDTRYIILFKFLFHKNDLFFQPFIIWISTGSPEVTKRASPKMIIAVRSMEIILDIDTFAKAANINFVPWEFVKKMFSR